MSESVVDLPVPWYAEPVTYDEEGQISAEDALRVHEKAAEFASELRSRQYEEDRGRAEASLYLYTGSRRVTLSGATSQWLEPLDETPPYFNLIQTAVDYFTSTMVRNRVRPFFQVDGGDNALRQKAKSAQRAIEGTMTSLGIYDELGEHRVRDGHLFKAGGIKYAIDYENKRLVATRVRPWECFVPERESRLGSPRQLVHAQLVDRHVLAGMFPEDSEEREAIMSEECEDIDLNETVPGDVSDMVLVYEAWHLPSGAVDLEDASAFGLDDQPKHDGRRILFTKSRLLFCEPWPFDYFPIAWYKPRPDPVGYWSRSIPETIIGAQLALIEINDRVERILHRHAVPKILLWKAAGINKDRWDNSVDAIHETRVPPAQAVYELVPQAVPQALLEREAKIIAQAEKQLGTNEMALAGIKPKGLEHAPGMEHLSEIEMIRQTSSYHAYERAHLDDARIIMDLTRMLAEYLDSIGENYEVIFGDDKELVRVDWAEFDMKRSEYRLKLFPTDFFAATPTARFRQVSEMIDRGMFDGSQQSRMAMKALGTTDVEALIGDQAAPEDAIAKALELCIADKPQVDWFPTPDMNLQLCVLRAGEASARMYAQGADDEAIDRVRLFAEMAQQQLDEMKAKEAALMKAMAPPPPPGMPPGGAPPGMPPGPPGMPPMLGPPPGMPPGPPPGPPGPPMPPPA